jgi:ComEC/Rec2-related protein
MMVAKELYPRYTQIPLAKYAIALGCGIIIQTNIVLPLYVLISLLFGCTILLILTISKQVEWLKNSSLVLTIATYLASGLCLGNYITQYSVEPNSAFPKSLDGALQGEIKEMLSFDSSYTRCLVEGVLSIPNEESYSTTILLTVSKPDVLPYLKVGNSLYCVLRLKAPQERLLPTEFSEVQYCRSRGIQWMATAYENEFAITGRKNTFDSYVQNSANIIEQKIDGLYPIDSRGFVKALLLGDKREIPLEQRQRYALTGTAHVLAVSGLHVGILSAILFVILSVIPKRSIRFSIFAFAVISFVIITGNQPSALRAGLMILLIVWLKLLERNIHLLNALSATVIILLMADPAMLYSAGFQLSVGSIIGIGLFYRPFLTRLEQVFYKERRWKKYVLSAFALTLSAGIIVAPFVAWYFRLYSTISPIANLFMVPLASLSMIVSLMSLLAECIWHPLAVMYANLADILIYGMDSFNSLLITIFSFAELKKVEVISLSCFLSLATIYVISTNNKRMFLFRCGFIAVVTLLLQPIITVPSTREHHERKKYTVELIPLSEKSLAVFMNDIHHSRFATSDFAMEKYLLSMPYDSLILVVNGTSSLCTADSILSQSITQGSLPRDRIDGHDNSHTDSKLQSPRSGVFSNPIVKVITYDRPQ